MSERPGASSTNSPNQAEEHIGCAPMKHTQHCLRDRSMERDCRERKEIRSPFRGNTPDGQGAGESTAPDLSIALRQDEGVDNHGEDKQAEGVLRPTRPKKPTRKKQENMKSDGGTGTRARKPLPATTSDETTDATTTATRAPLPATTSSVQTRRQGGIKKQPLRVGADLGPSPPRMETPSPGFPSAKAVATASGAAEDGTTFDGVRMGRRGKDEDALVVTPGGTISKALKQHVSDKQQASTSQELMILPLEEEIDGTQNEVALRNQSRSLEEDDMPGGNIFSRQSQEPLYHCWEGREVENEEDDLESPNWRILGYSPVKGQSASPFAYDPHRRHERSDNPEPSPRRGPPPRPPSSTPFPTSRGPSNKRKHPSSATEDALKDRTEKRRRISDAQRSITLLSHAVLQLSLLHPVPVALTRSDLSCLHNRINEDRFLTAKGKAVVIRELGERGNEVMAGEYVFNLRDAGVRREWLGLGWPDGWERGMFVEGEGGSKEQEVRVDDQPEEEH